jgi:porphobilinogen synthase
MKQRPRRNRKSAFVRDLVRESKVSVEDLIWPVFVKEGIQKREEIKSMPGVFRLSEKELVQEAKEAHKLGIRAVALFPAIDPNKKDPIGSESLNKNSLVPRAVRALKSAIPDLVVITDVALDPFSSDGHDGIVRDGEIVNDESVELLAQMAVVHAEAGADFVAPSDMMDGRVGAIREALDQSGHSKVGILSYCAKYASSFYGPFRDALDSAPKSGDKKTYQMDPANAREALREAALDVREGADILMVKPGMPYLDVLYRLREKVSLPLAVYQVSGEYAMICAAAERGMIDRTRAIDESLVAFKRAGADMILTYFAKEWATAHHAKR